jgi:hypothetical protein
MSKTNNNHDSQVPPMLADGEEMPDDLAPADFDDVQVLVCEKGVWKWLPHPDVAGDKPSIKARHSACLIPVGKKVIVFGGIGQDGERHDDLHILTAQNVAKMDWMHIPAKSIDEAHMNGGGDSSEAGPDDPATGAGAEGGDAVDAPADGAAHAGGEEAEEEHHAPAKKQDAQTAEEGEEEKPAPPLKAPGKRLGSGVASVDGKVYVFGGEAVHDDGSNRFTKIVSIGVIAADKGTNVKTIEKDDDVTWMNADATGEIPPARSDFVMTVLEGKVVMYGGYDANGKAMDDMYSFDAEKLEWTCMYASDGSTMPAHPINGFVQKRLFSIAGSRSTYDDVRVLEFGKIGEQSQFVPKMTARVTEELDKLQAFEDSALQNLSIDPNKGENEDKQRDLLLKVNSCIYEFKLQQPAIELQLDVLRDAVALLQKQGVNMDKSESHMNEAAEKWSAVKKQAPVAKEAGRNVQEREALKIKKNIDNFENRVKVRSCLCCMHA